MCFGAIASIAGPVLGGLISKSGQEDANASNAKQAQAQMNFEERMSNTSYQRAVTDMNAAGINPMLAFMRGGASTPSGASAHMENTLGPLGEGVSNAAANAANNANMTASTAKIKADTVKSVAEADLASAQAAEAQARTPTYEVGMENTRASTGKIRTEVDKIAAETDMTYAQTNKLRQEASNLALVPNLTVAQTKETLAKLDLTTAQIAEVVPRIMKLNSETALNRATLPWAEAKGAAGDLVNLPKILHGLSNSGKSGDPDSFGSKFYDFLHPSNTARDARRHIYDQLGR